MKIMGDRVYVIVEEIWQMKNELEEHQSRLRRVRNYLDEAEQYEYDIHPDDIRVLLGIK